MRELAGRSISLRLMGWAEGAGLKGRDGVGVSTIGLGLFVRKTPVGGSANYYCCQGQCYQKTGACVFGFRRR